MYKICNCTHYSIVSTLLSVTGKSLYVVTYLTCSGEVDNAEHHPINECVPMVCCSGVGHTQHWSCLSMSRVQYTPPYQHQ